MRRVVLLFISTVFIGLKSFSQDDLLKLVDSGSSKKQYVTNAFKSSRVINGQSMEFIGKGVLDFRILHRFGPVSDGIKQMFGLDVASMRMGFDYGLGENLTIGVGRSTLNKELDGFIKYRPIRQANGSGGSPLSVIIVAGTTLNTLSAADPANKPEFRHRMAYYYQIIAGRKFNERFTLQLTPTLLHRNLVARDDENNIYALGVGARIKLSKRIAFVADYFYLFNGLPESANHNPLSLGFDIETGGHVFQLHFSNSRGMNERAFLAETTNDWGKGEIQFGFNLSRVFNVGKRRK